MESSKQCQALLTQIGKRTEKFDLSTKGGLEQLKSFLLSNVKTEFTKDQLRSIWDAMISMDDRAILRTTVLDVVRIWNNKYQDKEVRFEDRPTYLNWPYDGWCDGEKNTATIKQMLHFVTHVLMDRVGNQQKLVEQPLSIQRKDHAISVAKAMCDPSLMCDPSAQRTPTRRLR